MKLSFSPGKDMKDKRLKEKKGEGQEDKIWKDRDRRAVSPKVWLVNILWSRKKNPESYED